MQGEPRSPLRSDARDNRARILAVARAAFAGDGLDVPIRVIARRAEVGVATVYRHFPTKEALLSEAFAEQMASCASIVDEGLARDDPWDGFCLMIEKLMIVHALDRGFARAFTSRLSPGADSSDTASPAGDLEAERDRTLRRVADLLRRAKRTGRLREDVVVDDLVLVLMANEGIRTDPPARRVAASRRFAALVIESFRAGSTSGSFPPPVALPLVPIEAAP